jgi:hypothetical protein
MGCRNVIAEFFYLRYCVLSEAHLSTFIMTEENSAKKLLGNIGR